MFSTSELIIVLVIALVIFGPGKLPEVGRAIGKGINEFKGAVDGSKVKSDAETTAQAGEAKKEDIVVSGVENTQKQQTK